VYPNELETEWRFSCDWLGWRRFLSFWLEVGIVELRVSIGAFGLCAGFGRQLTRRERERIRNLSCATSPRERSHVAETSGEECGNGQR